MVGLQVIPVPVVPSAERFPSANPEEEMEPAVSCVRGDAMVSKKDTYSVSTMAGSVIVLTGRPPRPGISPVSP